MTEFEQQAEALIASFNEWFQARGNGPIDVYEKAALKTFIWFLANEKKVDLKMTADEVQKG